MHGAKKLNAFRISAAAPEGPTASVEVTRAQRPRGVARVFLSRAWQEERTRILRRLCLRIDERRAVEPVEKQCRRIAGCWRNRRYKSVPSKRVRISKTRLRTLYYAWRRSGRSDSVFALRYVPGQPSFEASAQQQKQILDLLLSATVVSFASIYSTVFPRGTAAPSTRRFYDLFSPEVRELSQRIFRARLNQQAAEQKFAGYIAGRSSLR
jgi:hypothetical protein